MSSPRVLAVLLAAPLLVILLGPAPGGGALEGLLGLYGLDVRCSGSAGRLAELAALLDPPHPSASLALLHPATPPQLDAVVAPLGPVLLGGLAQLLGLLGADSLLRLLCWWAAALGAWLLGRALGQGSLGALASGLALAWGPWTVATLRTESLDQLLGLGLPGALGLWLLGGRRRHPALALLGGAGLAALAWSSAYAALVALVFLIWLGLEALRPGLDRRSLGLGLLAALLLGAPPLLAQARHLGGHDWSSAPVELLWLNGKQASTRAEALGLLGLDPSQPGGLVLLGLALAGLLPGPRLGLRLLGGGLLTLGAGLLAAGMAEEGVVALNGLGPLWRAREPVHFGLGPALGLALLAGWGVDRLAAWRAPASPLILGLLGLCLLAQAHGAGVERAVACAPVSPPPSALDWLAGREGALLVLAADPEEGRLLELFGAAGGGAASCSLGGAAGGPGIAAACRRAARLASDRRPGPGACAALLATPGAVLAGEAILDPLPEAPGWRAFSGGPCPRSGTSP